MKANRNDRLYRLKTLREIKRLLLKLQIIEIEIIKYLINFSEHKQHSTYYINYNLIHTNVKLPTR